MNDKQPLISNYVWLFLLLIVIALVCTVSYLLALAYNLDGLFHLHQIQQSLDAACGKGTIIADLSGYSGDPMPTWYGQGAGCYRGFDGEFVCSCS